MFRSTMFVFATVWFGTASPVLGETFGDARVIVLPLDDRAGARLLDVLTDHGLEASFVRGVIATDGGTAVAGVDAYGKDFGFFSIIVPIDVAPAEFAAELAAEGRTLPSLADLRVDEPLYSVWDETWSHYRRALGFGTAGAGWAAWPRFQAGGTAGATILVVGDIVAIPALTAALAAATGSLLDSAADEAEAAYGAINEAIENGWIDGPLDIVGGSGGKYDGPGIDGVPDEGGESYCAAIQCAQAAWFEQCMAECCSLFQAAPDPGCPGGSLGGSQQAAGR